MWGVCPDVLGCSHEERCQRLRQHGRVINYASLDEMCDALSQSNLRLMEEAFMRKRNEVEAAEGPGSAACKKLEDALTRIRRSIDAPPGELAARDTPWARLEAAAVLELALAKNVMPEKLSEHDRRADRWLAQAALLVSLAGVTTRLAEDCVPVELQPGLQVERQRTFMLRMKAEARRAAVTGLLKDVPYASSCTKVLLPLVQVGISCRGGALPKLMETMAETNKMFDWTRRIPLATGFSFASFTGGQGAVLELVFPAALWGPAPAKHTRLIEELVAAGNEPTPALTDLVEKIGEGIDLLKKVNKHWSPQFLQVFCKDTQDSLVSMLHVAEYINAELSVAVGQGAKLILIPVKVPSAAEAEIDKADCRELLEKERDVAACCGLTPGEPLVPMHTITPSGYDYCMYTVILPNYDLFFTSPGIRGVRRMCEGRPRAHASGLEDVLHKAKMVQEGAERMRADPMGWLHFQSIVKPALVLTSADIKAAMAFGATGSLAADLDRGDHTRRDLRDTLAALAKLLQDCFSRLPSGASYRREGDSNVFTQNPGQGGQGIQDMMTYVRLQSEMLQFEAKAGQFAA